MSKSLDFPEFIPDIWANDKLLFKEPINKSDDQEDYLLLFHQFISYYKPDLNLIWFSEVNKTFFPVYLSIARTTLSDLLIWIKTLSIENRLKAIDTTNSFISQHIFFEPESQITFCSILYFLSMTKLTPAQALSLHSDWALNLYYFESLHNPNHDFHQIFRILNHLEDLF